MVEIQVCVSTNATDKEKKRLSMPRKAVEEFLATGFAENAYDATVLLRCEPRAVPPEYMQIIVDLKELGETAIVWKTIIGGIIKLCKKCKGYEPDLVIKRKKGNE